MRKLGLRFILPAAQLVLALILLSWGNHTKAPPHSDTPFTPSVTPICFGINAPALLLRALGAWLGTPRMDKAPAMLSGFGLDEWFFLVGVILCWYLVGLWLDSRTFPQVKPDKLRIKNLVLSLLALAVGAVLFLSTIFSNGPWTTSIGGIIEKGLIVIWSIILIGIPSVRLAHDFGMRASSERPSEKLS
jgi:hypothetical protein